LVDRFQQVVREAGRLAAADVGAGAEAADGDDDDDGS